MPEVENRIITSRKVFWLFYGISTGSILLQCFLRGFYLGRHGSSMETWPLGWEILPGWLQGEESW
jgi:hypothetical protein